MTAATGLGLPPPPTLSPQGQILVAAERGTYRRSLPAVEPPKIGTPCVGGRLLVILTDRDDWTSLAARFWPVSYAPDNAEVIVRLPLRQHVSLLNAVRGWDCVPTVRFTIEHWDTARVQVAVVELRQAIDMRIAELSAVAA